MAELPDMGADEVIATVNLVGRTGAKNLEIGYLHDDVPSERADWYAHAQYKGARIIAEHHTGPVEALEALASRLLTGAKCAHCGGLVALSKDAAFAYFRSHLVDGTTWNAAQAAAAGQCHWRRDGARWVRGCEQGPKGQAKRKKPGRKRRG